MVPFDGQFAQSYALPLATAAYDATTPPQGFARTWEIIAGPAQPAPLAAYIASATSSPASMSAYNAMVMQPPKPAAHTAHLQSLAAPAAATPPNLHFGWVCADTTTNTLSIAIRGTQYFEEWLKDFDFIAVPYQPIPGRGTVHQGFQIVYESIRASLQQIIHDALAAFPSLKTLFITGHSLGAAVVGLAAPDLLLTAAKGLAPIVYTFAEPRVGHHDYMTFFNSVINICYRIANFWDLVPHLPPLLALYEHEGQQLTIDSGFNASVSYNHSLATGYVPGLARWIAQHPVHAIVHFGTISVGTLVGVSP